MAEISIPPPSGNLSTKPDAATLKADDYTGGSARNRVLFMDLGFFKYGTNDKTHAAAILLSLIILVVIVFVIIIGTLSRDAAWLDKIFTWLGSAFLFVSGVAVGRGTTTSNKDGSD